MLDHDMKRVVDQQRLGYVATVGPDATPNLSPKETTAVWDDEHGTGSLTRWLSKRLDRVLAYHQPA